MKPRIKLSGNLERDLYAIGEVDTYYFDKLYLQMNATGLYRGNNEVLRTLHGRFRQIKNDFDQGVPRTKENITKSLENIETLIENASLALDHLGKEELALFYGCPAAALAMAVKEYAEEHLSHK